MRIASTWTERLAQVALALAVLYALYRLGARVAPVLSPVVFSFVLAYFLDPVIDRLERVRLMGRGLSRTFAITLVALVGLGATAIVLALVVPMIVTEVVKALQELPAWAERTWETAQRTLHERFGLDIHAELDSRIEALTGYAQEFLVVVGQATLDWSTAAFNVVLVPIFTFYFLRDFDEIKVRPLELIPPRWRPFVVARARAMDAEVGNWVRGQFQVALALSALYALGLGIVGVKLGVFLGVVAGLISVVPYLGFALGSVAAVLMALVYGGDDTVAQLVGLTIVFAGVQLVEGYVLTPKLVGEKMGMSPLTVMVVLLLGGSLFGFYGLLLSVPVVAAVRVVALDVLEGWRSSEYFRAESFAKGEEAEEDDTPIAERIRRVAEADLARMHGSDAGRDGADETSTPPSASPDRADEESVLDTSGQSPLDADDPPAGPEDALDPPGEAPSPGLEPEPEAARASEEAPAPDDEPHDPR